MQVEDSILFLFMITEMMQLIGTECQQKVLYCFRQKSTWVGRK